MENKFNLEVNNLTKSYNDLVAVNNLSFKVAEGQIYALLGVNGAGKTTTFECIEGLIKKDKGEIKIDGVNFDGKSLSKINRDIGIQLQMSSFQSNMKVSEIIKLISMYYQCEINEQYYEKLNMSEICNKKFGDLSVGQKKRVTLYLAIMHKPKLVILDEPTAGLDVLGKNVIYELLHELKNNNTSILISSHDLSEIERLADYIGIIVKGNLVKEASLLEITASSNINKKLIIKTELGIESYLNELGNSYCKVDKIDDYSVFYTDQLQNLLFKIINLIESKKDIIEDLRIEHPSLEEIFIQVVN